MTEPTEHPAEQPKEHPMEGKRFSWLSVLAFCFSWGLFTAPLGIILGFVAKNEIRFNSNLRGAVLATWAIGIGAIPTLIVVSTPAVYYMNYRDWKKQCYIDRGALNSPYSDQQTRMQILAYAQNPPKFWWFLP